MTYIVVRPTAVAHLGDFGRLGLDLLPSPNVCDGVGVEGLDPTIGPALSAYLLGGSGPTALARELDLLGVELGGAADVVVVDWRKMTTVNIAEHLPITDDITVVPELAAFKALPDHKPEVRAGPRALALHCPGF